MFKKICFFTTHFDFPRQRYLDYYEKILPKEVECFLFYKKEKEDKFKTKRIKKVSYSCSKIKTPFELHKFCKQNEIEAVVNLSGSSDVSISLCIATIFTKTKNIFYFHGNPNFYKKDFIFFFEQFFIDRFLVSALDITEKVKKNLFFSKNKIFNLPLSVDTDLYNKKSKIKTRKKLGLNVDDKIIIFVGRISFLKGSDLMLELIKKNKDKKFLLIGQILDENYKNLSYKNVMLINSANAKELADYYNASDLCLLLSRTEGFGLAPREAMACGVPTIVSDIESLRMIKSAIKVPLNVEKAQEALVSFFKMEESQKKILSEKSREYILEECSEQNPNLKEKHLKYFLEF